MRGILGKKVGMTRIFDEQGEVIPVTVIRSRALLRHAAQD